MNKISCLDKESENMSEWREVRLGEIVETNSDSFSNKDNWKYVNYLDTGSITQNTIDTVQKIDLNVDKLPSRAKRKVMLGDVLFSNVRPIQQHYGYLNSVYKNMLVSTGFTTIRAKENAFSKFIYYFLTQRDVIERLQAIAEQTVSTYPAIRPSDIEDLELMLPPLPEQKAIAETLSCLDEKIELNNKINANLEQTAQAIFKNWFVDFEPFKDGEFVESELGRIPEGWRVGTLGDITKFIKGKKPKELYKIKIDNHQAQYLTIDVLNGGHSQFAYIEKMAIADEYDILMVMDGASSGTVYFGLNGIIASTIAKVEVQNEQYKEIVYQYLKTNQAEVKSHNTGSAIPHTDKGYVSKCKIVFPPEIELNKIADILLQIRKTMLNNSSQNKKLASIRDTLLPKLMSGELSVVNIKSVKL